MVQKSVDTSGKEAPLYALVKRHLPAAYQDLFQFKLNPGLTVTNSASNIHDTFRVSNSNNNQDGSGGSAAGKILIEGVSLSALGAGLNHYLRTVCQVEMTWSGDRFDQLPAVPPRLTGDNSNSVVKASFVPWRYYMNVVTFGYSFAFWDWSRWERELDWMMLNGINMALAMVGQEYVVRKFYEDQGLNRDEINGFIGGPAFMPWQRMGNIQGSWGFVNDTQYKNDWIDSQWELQGQIMRRMEELNITAIMPSFNGFVPMALPAKYPSTKFEKASQWGDLNPYSSNTFVPSTEPLFMELSKKYIQLQNSLYKTSGVQGSSHHYLLDLYNELSPTCTRVDCLQQITSGVMKSLKAADPDAVWVMQGWFLLHRDIWQPPQTKAFFDGIRETNQGRDAFVIDLYSDIAPLWNSTEGFFGIDWGWSMLNNFGGQQALYGTLPTLLSEPFRAYNQPRKVMKGMGITMEGINNNEYLYQLIFDIPWESVEATYPIALNTPPLVSKGMMPPPDQKPPAESTTDIKSSAAVEISQQPLNADKHLDDFIRRRYGPNQTTEAMLQTWRTLSKTVWDIRSGQMSQSKSYLVETPSLDMRREGFLSTIFFYDKPTVVKAWGQFVESTQTEASKTRRGPSVIQNAFQEVLGVAATGGSKAMKRQQNEDGTKITGLWTSFSARIRDAIKNTVGQRQQPMVTTKGADTIVHLKSSSSVIQTRADPNNTPSTPRLPTESELPLNVSSFRYDLVDVTREIMAAVVIPGLQKEFVAAYRAKNLNRTRALGRGLLDAILDTDKILATHSHFMLGPWIRDARVSAKTVAGDIPKTMAEEEQDTYKDYLEFNARNQITWWGPTGQQGLADYAAKQWAGLVKEFYYPRWQIFVDRVVTAVQQGRTLDYKSYLNDSLAVESVWQKEATCLGGGCLLKEEAMMRKDRVEKYAVDAVGDTIETAQDLWDRWGQTAMRLAQEASS
ncbi:hypothetical protein BGZ83_004839 [Gryganskiella cystojenkinii]|nr:hypothetical protein BGZ83_004839 [Gryganskiella cystojenkinii]